jgi:hypothetical protein
LAQFRVYDQFAGLHSQIAVVTTLRNRAETLPYHLHRGNFMHHFVRMIKNEGIFKSSVNFFVEL